MPRIRSIKPEFPEDEALGAVSRDARYLFILCWTRCDDLGRFRAAPALLASQLYPYDSDVTAQTVSGWLEELEAVGRLKSYVVNDQQYAEVSNWSKHQRIDNASKTGLMPDPPWAAASGGEPPQDPRGGRPPAAGEERSGEGPGRGVEGESAAAGVVTATSRADLALGLLADRITASQPRDNATRYRASTFTGLKKERGVAALEFANKNPTWTPGDIAEALQPSGRLAVIRAADPDCVICRGAGAVEEVPCSCKWREIA